MIETGTAYEIDFSTLGKNVRLLEGKLIPSQGVWVTLDDLVRHVVDGGYTLHGFVPISDSEHKDRRVGCFLSLARKKVKRGRFFDPMLKISQNCVVIGRDYSDYNKWCIYYAKVKRAFKVDSRGIKAPIILPYEQNFWPVISLGDATTPHMELDQAINYVRTFGFVPKDMLLVKIVGRRGKSIHRIVLSLLREGESQSNRTLGDAVLCHNELVVERKRVYQGRISVVSSCGYGPAVEADSYGYTTKRARGFRLYPNYQVIS